MAKLGQLTSFEEESSCGAQMLFLSLDRKLSQFLDIFSWFDRGEVCDSEEEFEEGEKVSGDVKPKDEPRPESRQESSLLKLSLENFQSSFESSFEPGIFN